MTRVSQPQRNNDLDSDPCVWIFCVPQQRLLLPFLFNGGEFYVAGCERVHERGVSKKIPSSHGNTVTPSDLRPSSRQRLLVGILDDYYLEQKRPSKSVKCAYCTLEYHSSKCTKLVKYCANCERDGSIVSKNCVHFVYRQSFLCHRLCISSVYFQKQNLINHAAGKSSCILNVDM
ncbi:hypothetical protein ACOME3_008310 [Neoechinorhynchus agilis]